MDRKAPESAPVPRPRVARPACATALRPDPALPRQGRLTPGSLAGLQRSRGNRFVLALLAPPVAVLPGATIQRAVKRTDDGTIGDAGWTRLDLGQQKWVWKDGAEERWNEIAAVYSELKVLEPQLGPLARQHGDQARIRRALYAMFPYTAADKVIGFDESQTVLTAMSNVRDRAQAVIATPPATDDPGPLAAHQALVVPAQVKKRPKETTGAFETRTKLIETKREVNAMVAHMNAADLAFAKATLVRDRRSAAKGTGADPVDLAEELADARLYVEDAWRSQQEARKAWRAAAAHPYNTVMGMPNDADVTAALKRYSDWWKTFGTGLSALDRQLFTTDKPKPGELTAAHLENDKPDVFRTLVLLDRLSLKNVGGNTYKKGGNKTFEFKETDQWELHIHEESAIAHQRGRVTAHYKPVSQKYELGFNSRNPVDLATLHKLGVDIS